MGHIEYFIDNTLNCTLKLNPPLQEGTIEFFIKTERIAIQITETTEKIEINLEKYFHKNMLLYFVFKNRERKLLYRVYVKSTTEKKHSMFMINNTKKDKYLNQFYDELKEVMKYVES